MMTLARARDLVRGFPDQRILVVGDVMLDRYIFGAVERISPEAPVPVLHAHEETQAAGGAGNVAKNVARLGASTTLLSIVGDDESARVLERALTRDRVTPTLLHDRHRPTTEKIRYLQRSHQLLRVDYEERASVATALEAALIEELDRCFAGVGAVIVSDYAKGVLTPGVAAALVERTRRGGVLLAADVKPMHASLLAGATLMSPNVREAHEFLALDPLHATTTPEELARRVAEKLQTNAFVTLAERGICIHARMNGDVVACVVPQIHAREVADVSGAGDTAIAVLTLALCAGATSVEAAELANAACAAVVAKIGAAAVTADELLATVHETQQIREQATAHEH